MKNYRTFEKGSPPYVYYQGLARAKFGKRPTAILFHKFSHFGDLITITDREVAFNIARFIVSEDDDTLLGRPFIQSEIDWGLEYEKHLLGPDKENLFSPQSGIEQLRCKECFYRDSKWPNNPKRDCQIGENGDVAKDYFGWPSNVFLPNRINGKDVGHFCPHYLNTDAK